MTDAIPTRCGYVAIVGKPNVGKSTLLNKILGQKLSITSKKPQTTRHQLLGIKTSAAVQVLYVDTPGLHSGEGKAINRYMNRAARSVISDVDVVILVLDRDDMDKDDRSAMELVRRAGMRQVVVINKIDRLKRKDRLLPLLQGLSADMPDAELIPISAKTGEGIEKLESLIERSLPKGPFYFPEEQMTDRSERFLVSELLREKLMRHLDKELPYELAIEIEKFTVDEKLIHIDALVLVERDSQKGIVLGAKGSRLKKMATEARQDMERLLGKQVMLNVWVKTRSGWSDDDRVLKSLGYDNQ